MLVPRIITRIALGTALALSSTTFVACGGSQKVVHANVKPGDMPEGGDWTGVFYSETYGYLHLTKEGDTVSGCWRNTAGDEFGQLSGKATGDVLHYDWHNHKIGMVGAAANQNGEGWFRYTRPKEGEADVLKGMWGLEHNDSTDSWEAVKQQNMTPDCKKVLPDKYERGNVGGGWDSPPPGQGAAGAGNSPDNSGGDDSDMAP